uniref:Uncharacterized protein n=1 Tax=Poecilia mexicana TaxID=48701 RepID=A0A3B3Y7U0_9TELE
MLWSPKLPLSIIHVRLTAKGLLRNIQLLSGCRKSPVVFKAVCFTSTRLVQVCDSVPSLDSRRVLYVRWKCFLLTPWRSSAGNNVLFFT